ncbi:flagellar biosynthetic protein FliR [Duganella dendranthematis]|jgi:flagellar biosynthetic protein FliR|uniref:Flagellar biosynthetic protein FliR n=1 Tax=Duganella dendranthematis TaxID=2728021 RepID=A0ABX6M532_9BURK|nr:flagellar biosynthetic protein FliR [Duganella dendranthematis]QJD89390.1 flagellar biosynthetic protein FliR [Duganella dendranthematis]
MLTVSSADINMWIAGLLWPLCRIMALIAASPLLGNSAVPASVKLSLGVMIAAIVAPAVPAWPATDPMSWAGLLIVMQEMLIGLAMGFSIRIIFAAVEMAGEISSLTMGLGFATFFDPTTQGRSSAISQFLSLVATMAFLAVNGHLVLLSALVESFSTLPVSAIPVYGGGFKQLADWGGMIFSVGVQLSLPIVAALLITNVALGILTRAAPQLNLFGIGFPITLGVGLLVIAMTLPYLGMPIQNLFLDGIERARLMPRTWSQRPQVVKPATVPVRPAVLQPMAE